MKVLVEEQIKEADRYTVINEPISSADLMERASNAIACWIDENIDSAQPLLIVAGKGNNGGDGLAVARILQSKGFDCSVYLIFEKERLTPECALNLERLPSEVRICKSIDKIGENTVIIDAALGSGVYGEVNEPLRSLFFKINQLNNKVISIDLPSGMKTGFGNTGQTVIRADITLALEFPKLAMLLPEAGEFAGTIVTIPIGLSGKYLDEPESPYHYIDESLINSIIKRRKKFAYKNLYGHALLICGSAGMTGAAVLATSACLRSGCGLVTTHIPRNERTALQVSCPSAMLSYDKAEVFSELPNNLLKYNATGLGCGIGTEAEIVTAVENLLKSTKLPMVIDADAINIIAANRKLQKYIPQNSILTPHLGELKRLAGEWQDEEDKIKRTSKLAAELKSVIAVKGAHTAIHTPDGNIYFNSTGNAGMAKGGSGDILTGLITGLLARGYDSFDAAVLGVYFHGLAGDKAKAIHGMESMNSADILNQISIPSPPDGM